jgi:hypothetical protein
MACRLSSKIYLMTEKNCDNFCNFWFQISMGHNLTTSYYYEIW